MHRLGALPGIASERLSLTLERIMFAARLLSVAAGLAIVSACADPPIEPVPLDASLAATGLVPFEGVITHTSQTEARPGPSFDPGCVTTAADGAPRGEFWIPAPTTFGDVKATHLGTSSLTQNGCNEISNFAVGGPFLSIGEATITSANGDEVHYTYDGIVYKTLLADVDVVITGGTGRFTGASGGFSASSAGNVFVFPVVYPFNGTISSVGSLQ